MRSREVQAVIGAMKEVKEKKNPKQARAVPFVLEPSPW